MFKYETDIRESLSTLRINIPKILNYEDCALLVKDLDRKPHLSQNPPNLTPILERDTFYALSPNVGCERLPKIKKADLFFYHPRKSISTEIFKEGNIVVKKNPRNDSLFVEGIDNLTPVVNLNEIVYVNLGTCKEDSLGILQLVNKTKGTINKEEEYLV